MDYVAGEVVTPPRWMGRSGLEWLHRLTGDPARLWRRYLAEPWHVTASWVFVRATEAAPGAAAGRRDAPYVPRHAAGLVAMHEREDAGRVGLEVYYTGRQALADDPFRTRSRPYVVVGALVEQRVGPARLFVNFENLTDVRQTRWDPLLRPDRGPGGRWTTDAWTELVGRTVNGGVRVEF